MTPEGEIKKAAKKYLDDAGAHHDWPVQTGYGKRMLDCYACINGSYHGIEAKREGITEPDPHQADIMTKIRAAGGRTWVVTGRRENGTVVLIWIEITKPGG